MTVGSSGGSRSPWVIRRAWQIQGATKQPEHRSKAHYPFYLENKNCLNVQQDLHLVSHTRPSWKFFDVSTAFQIAVRDLVLLLSLQSISAPADLLERPVSNQLVTLHVTICKLNLEAITEAFWTSLQNPSPEAGAVHPLMANRCVPRPGNKERTMNWVCLRPGIEVCPRLNWYAWSKSSWLLTGAVFWVVWEEYPRDSCWRPFYKTEVKNATALAKSAGRGIGVFRFFSAHHLYKSIYIYSTKLSRLRLQSLMFAVSGPPALNPKP